MRFTKMHGLGNDYVYVNGFETSVPKPAELAVRISDRHFGVGGDGLILILPSEKADARMRMFNADGSEAQMCGNGLRCVAKYCLEHELCPGRELGPGSLREALERIVGADTQLIELTFETGAGVLTAGLAIRAGKVDMVGLDMGEPILRPDRIPVDVVGRQAVGIPVTVEGEHYLMTCVSMGNPHAVIYCKNVGAVDLEYIGPLLERHRLFPQRVNVHFVEPVSATEVIMRTWERGSGITLACGTGAAAVCVAGILASKTQRTILAHLPGGDLHLSWNEADNHVYLLGPAVEVFTGNWPDGD
ncbi:MAG: diaminopimelate epimerase [Sedimentisphaerales bacterium]|nr:diaminopimelate epimerase [Sedimentisphaerales bacterium]